MRSLHLLWTLLRAPLARRANLAMENLALRQQLAILNRKTARPRLRNRDRFFWVWLRKLWPYWRSALLIAQPDTVVKWQRQGFRLFWRWKSRRKDGRPRVDREVRNLIRRLSRENPNWGVARIQSELALLGYDVAESTVAKYMIRQPKPPSQTWRTFLANHANQIVACDFFTVPTVTFRVLYVFVLLRHKDRRILHVNVTQNPTADWTARQIVQTFPYDSAPRFLLRDNDSIYGCEFRRTVEFMGIEEVRTAFRSPWQNAYVERVIGSICRECLDRLIVLNQKGLQTILEKFVTYYNEHRCHQSLGGNAPLSRKPDPPSNGRLLSTPVLGGLHHTYRRAG